MPARGMVDGDWRLGLRGTGAEFRSGKASYW